MKFTPSTIFGILQTLKGSIFAPPKSKTKTVAFAAAKQAANLNHHIIFP
jgi:hypothetical protein